ncbi:hypothetical protein RGQ29_030511 [Quercus rubra]|uniref:YchF C-terminal domain-containing protein n=1 Tax=Quercus rubra TaxID=3512 RepID=A0AAN7IEC6_QUERU|nr:hypothetical protein RGQ29_030511 [Quercus rubra]
MTTTTTTNSYPHLTCQFPTIQRHRTCPTRHRFLPRTCAPVTRKLKLVVAAAAAETRAMKAAENGVLKKGIAEFYDESSGVWEDIWGDHMHHGFYDPDSTVDVSGHRAAQIRMIDEALQFAGVSVTSGPLCRQSPAPRSKAPPACSSFRQRRPSPKNSSHPLKFLLKNLSHLWPPLSPVSGSEVQGTTGLLQLPSTPPIANKTSALPNIIKTGFSAINLIYFFTAGPDEVKCWQIRKHTKSPQAAGAIHTDFERGFICAKVVPNPFFGSSLYSKHYCSLVYCLCCMAYLKIICK